MTAKRKVSITLDADLVDEFGEAGATLSAQVNAVLRDEVARRRRERALRALLDDFAERLGALPEDDVARAIELLRRT